MPPSCEEGSLINDLIESYADSEINPWPSLEAAGGEYQCIRRATCWTCPKGIQAAESEIIDRFLPGGPTNLLLPLLLPWLPASVRGDVRAFSPLCTKGVVLALVQEELLDLVAPDCMSLQSCAQCLVCVDHVSEQLREFFEEGWEGGAGKIIKDKSGRL